MSRPSTAPAASGLAPSEFSRAAYVTLGISCVTLALTYGVYYAYSVFLVALLREFGWSRSVLAGAFSIMGSPAIAETSRASLLSTLPEQ